MKDLYNNFTPSIISGGLDKENKKERNNKFIPVIGKIAAGLPIEAIENENENIPYPPNLNNKNEEFYGLKVEGDSMINAGINDGDTVIIKN